MKEAAGEANLTVVAIILIAVVVAIATPLVRSLMGQAAYRACCTDAGGIWQNGYCAAPTPTTCANREGIWQNYNKCALANGKNEANIYYRAVGCSS